MSQGMPEDRANTIQENKLSSGLRHEKNWLRHKGQALVIDEMCLQGATEEEMARELIKRGLDSRNRGFDSILKRVQTHLYHLTNAGVHNLAMKRMPNNKLIFDVEKMGGPADSPSKHDNSSSHVQPLIPNKEDFERAYRMIRNLGEAETLDAILDQISRNAEAAGIQFKSNWRMITERNIAIWTKGIRND